MRPQIGRARTVKIEGVNGISYSDPERRLGSSATAPSRVPTRAQVFKEIHRPDVELEHIAALASANNALVGRAGKDARPRRLRRVFRGTSQMDQRNNASLSRAEVHPAFVERLCQQPDITRRRCRISQTARIKTGRQASIAPGQKSWKTRAKQMDRPIRNTAKTQSSPANRPLQSLPLGIPKDLARAMSRSKSPFQNPHTGPPTRFVQKKHRYLWENSNTDDFRQRSCLLKMPSADRTRLRSRALGSWWPRGLRSCLNGQKPVATMNAPPIASKSRHPRDRKLEHAARQHQQQLNQEAP